MITNSTITIFHRAENGYTKYVLNLVWWHSEQKQQLTDKGMVRANIFRIRVPAETVDTQGRTYAKEADSTHWTVKKGDLVVRGVVETCIESGNDLVSYEELGKITEISVNDFGLNPHIRIGADA